MPDGMTEALRRLIRIGKEWGYVAHDGVDALPHTRGSPELVEDVVAMLNDMGIHAVPAAPGGGDNGAATPPAGT